MEELGSKTLWVLIFCLVITNCVTIGYFTSKNQEQGAIPVSSSDDVQNEVIATIGEETITRDQWMNKLEEQFGQETLKELVNLHVVEELAEKYEITVSDEIIQRELAVYKSMYNSLDDEQFGNEQNWEQQIRYSILLEELLTRDVSVSEEEIKKFYESNKELYDIDETYHLSHIIVKSEQEADMVIEELNGGSSFEALALEVSTDEFTANQGGDIGFISTNNEYVPGAYLEEASSLDKGEWSGAIKVDTGYAVIMLHEKIEGKAYTYDDVKSQIRRQIALEQMEGSVSVDPLWDELGVTWFYENK